MFKKLETKRYSILFVLLLSCLATILVAIGLIFTQFDQLDIREFNRETQETLDGQLDDIMKSNSSRLEFQFVADSIESNHEGLKFFVDSINGTIWVNPNRTIIGLHNGDPKAFGLEGKISFETLRLSTETKPNQTIHNSYIIEDEENGGLRIGAVHLDTNRGLLFGLVATQEKYYVSNFEIIRKSIYKVLFVLIPLGLFLAILAGIFFKTLKEKEAYSRKTNKRLKEEVTELETAINRTTTGIAMIETDGLITDANDKFKSYFTEGVIGKKFQDISYYTGVEDAIQQCIEKGNAQPNDLLPISLTEDQLHEEVYRLNPFLSVTFNFNRNPFASKLQTSDATKK